jgi:cytochrome b561
MKEDHEMTSDIANSQDGRPMRYGRVAIGLHWLSAILIIGLLLNGLLMTKLEAGDLQTNSYRIHAAMGSIVLLLTVIRLVWAWRDERPGPLPMARREWLAYRGVHLLLYAGAILTAISGTLLLVGSGLTPLASEVIPADIDRSLPVRTLHWLLAIAMFMLLVGHVGAALLYQRQRGRTFGRMGIGPV